MKDQLISIKECTCWENKIMFMEIVIIRNIAALVVDYNLTNPSGWSRCSQYQRNLYWLSEENKTLQQWHGQQQHGHFLKNIFNLEQKLESIFENEKWIQDLRWPIYDTLRFLPQIHNQVWYCRYANFNLQQKSCYDLQIAWHNQ